MKPALKKFLKFSAFFVGSRLIMALILLLLPKGIAYTALSIAVPELSFFFAVRKYVFRSNGSIAAALIKLAALYALAVPFSLLLLGFSSENRTALIAVLALLELILEYFYIVYAIFERERRPETIAQRIIDKYGGVIDERNIEAIEAEERTIVVLSAFLADYFSGGFLHYFRNSGLSSALHFSECLREIGLHETAERFWSYCMENGIDLHRLEIFDYEKLGGRFDMSLLPRLSKLEEIVEGSAIEKALKRYLTEKDERLAELKL